MSSTTVPTPSTRPSPRPLPLVTDRNTQVLTKFEYAYTACSDRVAAVAKSEAGEQRDIDLRAFMGDLVRVFGRVF